MPTHPRKILTVAICTHNRALDAIHCIAELCRQISHQEVDVLVIDNASPDSQHEILKDSLEKYNYKLIKEPTPGLSIARNRARQESNSDWIAYLDDDAIPDPQWISSAITYISNASDKLGFIGGKASPAWPETIHQNCIPPSSIGLNWRDLLSLVEEERPGPLEGTPMIVGCNMIIKTAALDEAGGFDTKLGRGPNDLHGGEEIAIMKKIHLNGWQVVFNSSIAVKHKIQANRLTLEWIKSRARDEGKLINITEPSIKKLAKCIVSLPILSATYFLTKKHQTSTNAWVRLWRNTGYIQSQFGFR